MAAQYDALGNYLGDWETEEERRKREEEERGRTVQTQTVETAADGTQTVTTEREIPAPVAPVLPVVAQAPSAAAITPPAVQPRPVSPQEVYGNMLQAESGNRDYDAQGRPITSPKGAMFAGQVMPATAAQPGFGVRPAQAQTPEEYNRVGREYFGAMLNEFGGDQQKAAAAYNAGPGAVRQAEQQAQQRGGSWTDYIPRETMAYIGKVFDKLIPSAQAGTLPQPQPGAGRGVQGMPQAYPGEGVQVATGRGVQGTTGPVTPGAEQPQPQAAPAQAAPQAAQAQPEVSPQQAAINRYQAVQDNPMALLALKNDERAPEFIRNRAGDRAAELMRLEVDKRKAAEEAKTLIPAAATGDRKAINTITKELQNQDGSWLKMILLGFISPQLAGEEAIKLGFGNKWVAATDEKGNTALIQTNARGLPLKGFTNDGKEIDTDSLVKYATGAAQKLDIVGGTYVNDKTGEVGRVVTDQKTGQSYIQTDTGRKPMSGFRPQSTTGTLDMQRVQQVQKQNIELAGDWAKLQMKVQGAAPEAANKFLGEFNAKFGTNYTLSAVAGSAPQISMETGQMVQAAPAPVTQAAPAPVTQAAPAAAQAAPQAVPSAPVAPVTQAAPAQAAQVRPVSPADIQKALEVGTATQKEYQTKFLPELNTQANQSADVRTYRKSIVDIMNRNPELIGFMQGTGDRWDESRNIVRDIIAGTFKDQQDLSQRIAKLNFPDTPQGRQARAAFAEIENLQRQIAPSTLKAVAGAGAVSEWEQKANRETIGDVTRLPMYTAYSINTRDQFQKDMKIAERDWSQGKSFTSETQHSAEWAKEKKRLQDEYDRIYRARAEYIAKYNNTPGAVVDAFKYYPVPEYSPGQGWQYGAYSSQARRPNLGSFVR